MKKQFFKMILMIAGVVTVAVILLSQSLYLPQQQTKPSKETAKSEQGPGAAIVQAPSDVVPSTPVQLDEIFPTILKSLTSEIAATPAFFRETELFTPYLRVLLRAIISPNAP